MPMMLCAPARMVVRRGASIAGGRSIWRSLHDLVTGIDQLWLTAPKVRGEVDGAPSLEGQLEAEGLDGRGLDLEDSRSPKRSADHRPRDRLAVEPDLGALWHAFERHLDLSSLLLGARGLLLRASNASGLLRHGRRCVDLLLPYREAPDHDTPEKHDTDQGPHGDADEAQTDTSSRGEQELVTRGTAVLFEALQQQVKDAR